MPKYTDGFVIPIPRKNLPAYWKMARTACKVWMDHGALAYFECIGDDLKAKCGIPFPKLAKTRPGETVLFSWIVYKSKAHRNAVNKKVMKDPRLAAMMNMKNMPFDMNRMTMGGFKVGVEA
ncbi:putative protein YbaA [Phycisphaerales bacterium]|nr:putative protein YbaA [Phycisphaerales bacterium]